MASVGVVWWRPHFSTAAIATAILVIALIGASVGWLADRSDDKAPPVPEQLDDVVAAANTKGQYPALQREGRFRSGRAKSYLFVLRDNEVRRGGIPPEFESPPSDEVRIYDEIDGRLTAAFRFHPQNFGAIEQGPEGNAPGFGFRLIDIVDLDRDGVSEILGAFDRLTFASGPFPVPVLISWDDEASTYRLEPLLDQPPSLRLPPGMPSTALAGYDEPTEIHNQLSSTVVRGYPADVVAVRHALKGPVLLAGYPEPSANGFNGRYEVKGWFLNRDSPAINLTECTHAQHVFASVRIPGEVPKAMAKALIRSPDKPGCGQA
jgi:hypothetical protein